MTFNTNKTAWSSRKDYRPLADPNPLSDAQAEDRLNQLDRAINGVGMHLDFASRCRRIVADAERRGVARHCPEPPPKPSKADRTDKTADE